MLGAAEAVARATRRRAGASRSRPRAACSPPTSQPRRADEVFGDPAGVAAGVWAPTGHRAPEDGGFPCRGRWPYCSGIRHSDWLFAGCRLTDGELRSSPDAAAELEVARHLAHGRPARHRQPHSRRRRRVRPRRARRSRCSGAGRSTGRSTASRCSATSRSRSPPPRSATRAARSTTRRAGRGKVAPGEPQLAERRHRRRRRGRGRAARRPRALLRRDRGRLGRRPGDAPVPRRAAHGLRLAATHAVRTGATVARAHVRPRPAARDLRELATQPALPRRPHRHGALPGQPGHVGARPGGAAGGSRGNRSL